MQESDHELWVAADDYRIVSADVWLCAQLHNSLAVCLYDAVEEDGALLHVRFALRNQSRDPNLTDNTLASDLILLDRALHELANANSRAQHWQGKLIAQSEDQPWARSRCEELQALVGTCLGDSGVTVISTTAHLEITVSVRFRPAMGQVRTLCSSVSGDPGSALGHA